MSGVAVNGTLGFLMVITLCFTLGDVSSVLATPTGYPFIQIFFNTTQSYAATNVMTTIIIVVLTSSVISEIATSSRQLWSFARDGGFPFSPIIATVSGELFHQSPHASALANTSSPPGQTWLEHPAQRRLHLARHHRPPFPHQHWLHSCP